MPNSKFQPLGGEMGESGFWSVGTTSASCGLKPLVPSILLLRKEKLWNSL